MVWELPEIAESKFNRHTVKAKLASDATISVQINGNDPAYGERVEQALSNLLRDCGKGRSKGASDWSKSFSDSPDAFDSGVSSVSDLDEFYEFFDDDDDDGGGAEETGNPHKYDLYDESGSLVASTTFTFSALTSTGWTIFGSGSVEISHMVISKTYVADGDLSSYVTNT